MQPQIEDIKGIKVLRYKDGLSIKLSAVRPMLEALEEVLDGAEEHGLFQGKAHDWEWYLYRARDAVREARH